MVGQAAWLARRLIQPRVCLGARLRGDSAACRLAEAGLQPRLDKFGGLSLHLAELRSPESLDGATFQGWLRDAIKQWRAEGRIAVWLHVPILQSRFVAAAAEQGFAYHHAEADSATLTLWLADGCSRLPCYATHQLGVAGAVFDADTGKVLVVQDRNKTTNVWKFPGGLSEPDEDIGKYLSAGEIMLMVVLPPSSPSADCMTYTSSTLISLRTRNGQELKRAFVRIEDVSMYTPKGQTAVREVFEETGVKSEFKSLLSIRQQHRHPGAFGKSDMYIICRLEPSSFNINFCQQECLRCEWMDLPELAKTKDTTPITSNVARLLLYGYREGFDKIDITMREFPAVYTGLFYKLYHRELPDHYRNMIDIQ